MKIRIDKYGSLKIERAGKWVTQQCPHTITSDAEGSTGLGCGHWCPLFGEPHEYKECSRTKGVTCPDADCNLCEYNEPHGQQIDICDDRTLYGTIEDMRGSA